MRTTIGERRRSAGAGLLALVLAISALGTARTAAAQAGDFQWRGTVAQGNRIEIRGVNGEVRAEPSGDGTVRVEARRHGRRSDPERVRIDVVEHEDGVTICAVYPTPERARRPNEYRPGGGPVDVQNNDVRVDFVVRVPAGVRLVGSTVNGTIESDFPLTVSGRMGPRALRGTIGAGGREIQTSTVNGNIRLRQL